ncbi:ribbon-helix-helix domain-containing protein [Thermodesulfobacteriota bacterium]
MNYHVSSPKKVKVTASLDAELVRTIDHFLKTSGTRSRSQFIEKILRNWRKEQKIKEIESQIEDYYLSQSDQEQQEDRLWTEIAANSAKELWKD